MAAAAAMISRKHRSYGYQYNTRGRYDDDDGPNVCWLTIFGMIGIALIGSGAWYAYDSFEDPRIVAIRPYNQAVEAWNTVHRAEFAETKFEWRVASPEPQTVTVEDENGKTHAEEQFKAVDPATSTADWTAMVQAMVSEPLAPDQNKEGILSYEPLRWEARGILPAHPPGHLAMGDDGNAYWTGPEYKVQLRTRTKDGKESVFDLEPISPMKEVSVPANQKMCRLHHANNYHNHRCWDRVAIAQVCLRLNHTSDGWKAPEGMQRGCAAGAELAFSRSCPGSSMNGRSQLNENPGCDFSNVSFTVRSVDDPHLIAQGLTAGTLNFGYTPHENWVTGIVMMCIGGVLLCPIAPLCCGWLFQKRSRHAAYMQNDSIFTPKRYDRTTTQSPNPSVGSGATDDDYRIEIQSHSRNSSQSPRRRRPNDKDAAPLGVGHANADYYGVQPGGQVDQSKSDLEMQGVASEQRTPGSNDWRARARAYSQ